jgi:hypothetical protein
MQNNLAFRAVVTIKTFMEVILKAEIYSGVIFNPANCHKQCRKMQPLLGGNELMYRQGLIARYGPRIHREHKF